MDNIKEKLLETATAYKNTHCDVKGNFKEKNLSKQETIALKKVKDDIKARELVVFTTDKSSRFSVDTPSNYEKAIIKHTAKDQDVKGSRVKQIENVINHHMKQFNKMFKVGSTYHHENRVNGATHSTNTPAPPLYGLRKDHK